MIIIGTVIYFRLYMNYEQFLFSIIILIIGNPNIMRLEMCVYLVSFREHGVQLLVCEGPVPLVDFPLPPPRLQLLWSHAHHMT